MNRVLFSRQSDHWETPASVITRFGPFDVDAAATRETAKAPVYFGPDHEDPRLRDALAVEQWGAYGRRIFLNPPYSQVAVFIACAAEMAAEAYNPRIVVTCLVPARTDTRWWHQYVWFEDRPRAGVSVWFLPGRLRFSGSANSAPFPSVVVRFR